ncbi:MAG: triose-phosphate isomerase [Verrucomicrobia bacterium GWF2_51_19]|nr:MAG: triose-phosphate isomerase [Verrucomicrobia bacterium GWF2_51_19]HCJ12002.1 triose-phosphate isomerase [Opitutae bacterium]
MEKVRRTLIAGNWKMNKTAAEAEELTRGILAEIGKVTDVNVVICPPFTALERVSKVLGNSTIQLGAQNMHFEPSGAFTGEISAEMLRNSFCKFVILGHSERRAYFKESDELINKKVLSALHNKIKPILCVGETLEEREKGKMLSVIKKQVLGGLAEVSKEVAEEVVVAYEPVWAIGTGKTATPEMAQEVHGAIRKMLAQLFGPVSEKIRILYGGSMKPENAKELLAQPDIDGGLIGGAALKASSFAELVKIALAQ